MPWALLADSTGSYTSPGSSNENLQQICSVVDVGSLLERIDGKALAVDIEDRPRVLIYIIWPDWNMSKFKEGRIGNVEMSSYSSLRCGDANQSSSTALLIPKSIISLVSVLYHLQNTFSTRCTIDHSFSGLPVCPSLSLCRKGCSTSSLSLSRQRAQRA